MELHRNVVEFTTLPSVIEMESELWWNEIGISLNIKLIYWICICNLNLKFWIDLDFNSYTLMYMYLYNIFIYVYLNENMIMCTYVVGLERILLFLSGYSLTMMIGYPDNCSKQFMTWNIQYYLTFLMSSTAIDVYTCTNSIGLFTDCSAL